MDTSCCRGTPSDVSNNEQYRALFGARASAELAVYQHKHNHVHLPDGSVMHADGSVCEDCSGEHHGHDPEEADTSETARGGATHAG